MVWLIARVLFWLWLASSFVTYGFCFGWYAEREHRNNYTEAFQICWFGILCFVCFYFDRSPHFSKDDFKYWRIIPLSKEEIRLHQVLNVLDR